jgi:hypothetical protein
MNATPVYAAPVEYAALLTGPAESPPVASPGLGNAKVTIDTTAHTMRVQVQFSGLVGNTTVTHIHAPTAAPGTGTAGVATPLPTFPGFPAGVTSGSYDQTFDLTLPASWNSAYIAANGGTPATAEAAFATALATGRAYLNVHSTFAPGGEIRGFLTPPVAGGKNLRISTGSVELKWDEGNLQASYVLLKYNTSTATASLIPLASPVTSYSDAAVANGVVYCYVLAPIGVGGAPLGLSDLECAMTGMAGGGPVEPGAFTLGLGVTATASMKWTTPPAGADSYLLAVIPLDATPPSYLPLPGTATTASNPVSAAGTCFQLIAFKGAGIGQTNLLCGIPGISTLSSAGTGEAFLQGLTRGVEQRLNGVTFPSATAPVVE